MHSCCSNTTRLTNRNRSRDLNIATLWATRTQAIRTGSMIVEMVGAVSLLAILLSIVTPVFLLVARERHAAEQRQFALQHAANLLEQPVTRRWNELEPGELHLPEASPELQSLLPKLERQLTVREINDVIPTRQLTVSIRWQNSAGQMLAPIQISTFVFQSKDDVQ